MIPTIAELRRLHEKSTTTGITNIDEVTDGFYTLIEAMPSLLTRAELLDEALDKIRRVRACWYLDPDAIALIDTFLARVTALDDKEQP